MQSIWNLRTWCLQGCKRYRLCVVAVLKKEGEYDTTAGMGNPEREQIFYESEARRIAALNEIFGDIELTAAEMRTLVWLCGWEECTVENVLSAIRKVMAAAEAKRREQPLRP